VTSYLPRLINGYGMAMITYTNGKKRYGNAGYSSSGKGKEEAC
jgi:hypothetical protein